MDINSSRLNEIIALILSIGALVLGILKICVIFLKKVASIWRGAIEIVHDIAELKKELNQTNKFHESFTENQEEFNKNIKEDLSECMIKLREVNHNVQDLMQKEDSVYATVLAELKEVIKESQKREDAYIEVMTKKLPENEKRLSDNERKMVVLYNRSDRLMKHLKLN